MRTDLYFVRFLYGEKIGGQEGREILPFCDRDISAGCRKRRGKQCAAEKRSGYGETAGRKSRGSLRGMKKDGKKGQKIFQAVMREAKDCYRSGAVRGICGIYAFYYRKREDRRRRRKDVRST